jgi:U6 snRNA-associated Sm-like protein LSm7
MQGGKGKGKGSETFRPAPKPSVINLDSLLEKSIRVKFTGGREVTGILKGHDPVPNVVLDECVEYLRDPKDPSRLSGLTRKLGLIVARGTSITVVSPEAGYEEIDNPFTQ